MPVKIRFNEQVGGYKYLKSVETEWKFINLINFINFWKNYRKFWENFKNIVKILENFWENLRNF